MPAPIGNRPAVGSPTSPSSTNATTDAPQTPATAEVRQPSTWLGRAADRVEARVEKAGIDRMSAPLAADRSVSRTVADGLTVSLSGGLGAQVAVRGSPFEQQLVATDPFRKKTNPDEKTWLRTSVHVGGNVSAAVGRAGFGLGANTSVEVIGAMNTVADLKGRQFHSDNLDDAAKQVLNQFGDSAASLITQRLPRADAMLEEIRKGNAGTMLPGSEFTLRSGTSASVGVPIVAGLSASASASESKFKTIKVLNGSEVYVGIGDTASQGASLGVGYSHRPDLPGGKLGDKLEDKATLSVGGALYGNSSQMNQARAVFNLDLPQHREWYDRFIKLPPAEAKAFLDKPEIQAATFKGTSSSTGAYININLGTNLLALSSNTTVKNGRLESATGSVDMQEASHARGLSGWLAKKFAGEQFPALSGKPYRGPDGEERSINLRGAEFVGSDGTKTAGMEFSFNVKDPTLYASEAMEWGNFMKAMGAQGFTAPTTAAGARRETDVGEATMSASTAMTMDAMTHIVKQHDSERLRMAMGGAFATIEGSVPLWARADGGDTTTGLRQYRSWSELVESAQTDPERLSQQLPYLREEYAKYTMDPRTGVGRELLRDMSAFAAFTELDGKLSDLKKRGAPSKPEALVPLFKTIGGLGSQNVRGVLLALKGLNAGNAGMTMTSASFSNATLGTQTTTAGATPALPGFDAKVGQLMAPPTE